MFKPRDLVAALAVLSLLFLMGQLGRWGAGTRSQVISLYENNSAAYLDNKHCYCQNTGVRSRIGVVSCFSTSSTQSANVVHKTDPAQVGTEVCSSDITADTDGQACADLAVTSLANGECLCLGVEGATDASRGVGCSITLFY